MMLLNGFVSRSSPRSWAGEPPSDTEKIEINDFGCGYGAMYWFLEKKLGPALGRYHGYDIRAEMLAVAEEQLPEERVTLYRSSEIVPQTDFSFVSGTFNVKLEESDEDWRRHIESVLQQLFENSRLGFAFNLLTTYVDWSEDHLFYGAPTEFFDYCKGEFSRYVTLIHDYPLYEWTILVKKDT